MPASMLQSPAEMLEAFVNLFRCSRRSTAQGHKDVTAQKRNDDLLAEFSTDFPDDVSNRSGQSDYSTDEADVAPGTSMKQASWNPAAQPFVPGYGESRRAGAGFDGFAPSSHGGGRVQQSPESDNLAALKQALDRLAPGEIATVKSMLDGKMREQPATSLPPGLYQSHSRFEENRAPVMHFSGSRLAQSRRPFAPFGAALHTKPKRLPESNVKQEHLGGSLATCLRELASVEDARVLSLRKINRLGLDSAKPLETYFAKFGTVERIMVNHTQCKSSHPNGKMRIRPAVLGFAVMSTAEEAQAALNHGGNGGKHTVAGVEIEVQTFQSHSIDGTS